MGKASEGESSLRRGLILIERTLESRSIDALPLINHFLRRLRLGDLLSQHVPPTDRRRQLAPATALGVLVRNLLLARVPLFEQAGVALEEFRARLRGPRCRYKRRAAGRWNSWIARSSRS